MIENDLLRLKAEYEERRDKFHDSDLYSSLNLSYLFTIQQRHRALVQLLKTLRFATLAHHRILEVGCGGGDVLCELLFHRMHCANLHGVDLIADRVELARSRSPGATYSVVDAQRLPYQLEAFDLILQFTVFSSILDPDIKSNIAGEMLRVIKPGGLILWYDFWLNPSNKQTKGIRPQEIRRLFPDCEFIFKRITLAPPIARRLVPISWTLAALLEKLNVLNTHYLVAIRPLRAAL